MTKTLGGAIFRKEGQFKSFQFLLILLSLQTAHSSERPALKVEVGKFGDGRSLKVLVRFENNSNFWVEGATWVPKMDEVEHIREVLLAIDEFNKVKKSIGGKW